MKRSAHVIAYATLVALMCAGVAWGTDYTAPLPNAIMYDQLKTGMGWREAYEVTRAPELQREPADFEATDLLRLEQLNRRCQVQLLRLHWYRGALHWVEYFQLDPSGVNYQERGDPDPVAERLVRRMTELSHVYASHWDELSASVASEGSPALQDKVKQMTDGLKHRLEELRRDTQR